MDRAAGVLLGAGPFLAYLVSRTVGMPGDPRDVGNWDHWVGTVSLLVEGALVVLSASMLFSLRHSGRPQLPLSGQPWSQADHDEKQIFTTIV